MIPQPKTRVTDTHVYFLNGPFSQWHPSTFQARLLPDFETMLFSHAEQYMMARKSVLFDDFDTLQLIMRADTPREQKELGRQVKNFDPVKWDANARDIVYEGNLAKFSQNQDLKEYLLSSGDRYLVEGAWYDKVWGVALAWDDDKILDPANWAGTNWLGEALMLVRAKIKNTLN